MAGEAKSNEYGAVLEEYKGNGTLLAKDGRETPCSFQAFQLCNGRVIVLCYIARSGIVLDGSFKAEAVRGTTSDGLSMEAMGLTDYNYLPQLGPRKPGEYLAYQTQRLNVNVLPECPSSSSQFAISNLTLVKPDIVIAHPLAQARLRGIEGYAESVQRLKTIKGIDVTGVLTVDAPDSKTCDAVASDICSLLSIASGTKVQWISRADYSESGAQIGRLHFSHVTKPYCPLPVIDPREPNDTDVFLKGALPTYLARRDKWGLSMGLIDAYLDAKAESDYLQMRAVKLAVAIEMLKEAFLEASEQRGLVRPKPVFAKIIPDLKKALGDVLSKLVGWEESDRAIVYGNIQGLNHRPFRELVSSLCTYLALDLNEDDIKLFVRCRDSLVHRSRFYCETADEEERRSIPPPPTPIDEYLWLIHLVDRLFLRLVGYRGPYIDWSKAESPTRRDTF